MHANDVFFAIHAAVVTAVTLFQCAMYDRGGQRISWLAGLGTAGSVAGIAAYLAAVVWAQQGSSGGGGHVPPGHTGLTLVPSLWFRGSSHSSLGGGALPCGDLLSWLSFLYFLSYIKLAVSLVKYIPQVCALCVLRLFAHLTRCVCAVVCAADTHTQARVPRPPLMPPPLLQPPPLLLSPLLPLLLM